MVLVKSLLLRGGLFQVLSFSSPLVFNHPHLVSVLLLLQLKTAILFLLVVLKVRLSLLRLGTRFLSKLFDLGKMGLLNAFKVSSEFRLGFLEIKLVLLISLSQQISFVCELS